MSTESKSKREWEDTQQHQASAGYNHFVHFVIVWAKKRQNHSVAWSTEWFHRISKKNNQNMTVKFHFMSETFPFDSMRCYFMVRRGRECMWDGRSVRKMELLLQHFLPCFSHLYTLLYTTAGSGLTSKPSHTNFGNDQKHVSNSFNLNWNGQGRKDKTREFS